ncbi:MAG: tail assembly chaperone [Limosilactobacillus coleohominis]|nr:tail assembly chaperone [Limosilactobacillus coleohominis]MDY3702780.1 tail assembly chaperone [Limosilactobacillus coleohominis]
MELTINDKKYTANFGVRFVRELDKSAGLNVQGASFGMGLSKALVGLKSYDPATLSDVLYFGMLSTGSHPTQVQLDKWLDNDADVEKLFDEVIKELNESNSVKVAAKNLKA